VKVLYNIPKKSLKFDQVSQAQTSARADKIRNEDPVGDVELIKVRGHAGIPGDEFAEDIATAVASTGQADTDMSAVKSNHRPYQEWRMVKVWEEFITCFWTVININMYVNNHMYFVYPFRIYSFGFCT
jgi:hypothetical protein